MTTSFAAFSQELSQQVSRTSQSVVAVRGKRSAGVGIHWRPGLVVTSCEALHPEDGLTLGLADGRSLESELLGSDPTTDVAILALGERDAVPLATLGDVQTLAIGELVFTVGRGENPRLGGFGAFASLGMVSQLGGPWRSQSGGQLDRYIVVSLNLGRGLAGSPLVNASGKIVGFNTYGPRRQILTIPESTVNSVLDQLQRRGKITRGYLGVGMQALPIPEPTAQQHGLTNQAGILIVSVAPESAAARGGLLLGDILVAAKGEPLENLGQMQALLSPQSVGQPLTLTLLRGGQLISLQVTVGER